MKASMHTSWSTRYLLLEKRTVKWLIFAAAAALLIVWLLETPAGLLGKADAIAYAVCHRIAVRSFTIGERQDPLCARCTGMYLGALLGLAYQHFQGRRGSIPTLKYILVFGPLFLAFGFDGANSYLHLFPGAPGLYQPENWLRLLTGTGMGLAIAAVLAPAFRQTVWTTWDQRPAFGGWKELGVLFGLAAVVDLLVLTENPLLEYPLALVSVLGVMAILGLVYTMVLVMAFKAENRFERLSDLTVYLTGGAAIALLQIALLDAARFWLTGTWQGFRF
jgi:uncharacterized membrane protein